MYNKPEKEAVSMMGDVYVSPPRLLPLNEDIHIQRTRKIFMIMLGVCLALSVVPIIGAIFGSGLEKYIGDTRTAEFGNALISILYYGFGLFVAHRYSQTGLHIFAWVGVILLVLLGIVLILLLLLAVVAIPAASYVEDIQGKVLIVGASMGAFIHILVGIVTFILSVIIVQFAFKLARLINAKQNLTIQQI